MKLRRRFIVLLSAALALVCLRVWLQHSAAKREFEGLRRRAQSGDLNAVMQMLERDPSVVNSRDVRGDTPLMDAVVWGSLDQIRTLLDHGAEINAKGQHGWTALHWTALCPSIKEEQRRSRVELLLARGAQINAKDDSGMTPLHHAAWGTGLANGAEIVQTLIAHGAEVDILAATLLGDGDRVRGLLEKNPASVEAGFVNGGPPALYYAALHGRDEVAKELIRWKANVNHRDNTGETALHGAAFYGHKEIAEILINNGASVNTKNNEGITPLMAATERGYYDMIELLTAKGVEVNARDRHGATALNKATAAGCEYPNQSMVVAALLVSNADPKLPDNKGTTPLHLVAANACEEQLRLLLDKHVEINAQDADGWTPLHCALGGAKSTIERFLKASSEKSQHRRTLHEVEFRCRPKIVRVLLEAGADPNIKDKSGMTPLAWARRLASAKGCKEALELLEKSGAKD